MPKAKRHPTHLGMLSTIVARPTEFAERDCAVIAFQDVNSGALWYSSPFIGGETRKKWIDRQLTRTLRGVKPLYVVRVKRKPFMETRFARVPARPKGTNQPFLPTVFETQIPATGSYHKIRENVFKAIEEQGWEHQNQLLAHATKKGLL